jgi:NAD(P)-dependent dehydrogenase (short-subunit alcohol dehydrogenase family)
MAQTVLITGVSSGIGAAAAELFSANGWNLIATLRNPSAAGHRNSEVGQCPTHAPRRYNRSSITEAIATGISRFGRFDTLINNAGYGLFGLFETTPREKIHEQFDVNLFGVKDVTRAILRHFRANKRGMIVNVSSGAGLFTLR